MKQVAYLALIAAMACLAVSSPTGAKPADGAAGARKNGTRDNSLADIGNSAGALGDSIAKGNGGDIASAAVGLAGSIVDTVLGKGGKKGAREALVTSDSKSESI